MTRNLLFLLPRLFLFCLPPLLLCLRAAFFFLLAPHFEKFLPIASLPAFWAISFACST
jgi:hypothetical protein